jgi:cell pole-organizing protein PopZ
MDTLPKDFLGLPIIIIDYEALCTAKQSTRTPTEMATRSRAASAALNEKSAQMGFADAIDELWDQMSSAMRNKVREACYEVLRRTDGSKDVVGRDFDNDNDARFLD